MRIVLAVSTTCIKNKINESLAQVIFHLPVHEKKIYMHSFNIDFITKIIQENF